MYQFTLSERFKLPKYKKKNIEENKNNWKDQKVPKFKKILEQKDIELLHTDVTYMDSELRKDLPLELTLRFISASKNTARTERFNERTAEVYKF